MLRLDLRAGVLAVVWYVAHQLLTIQHHQQCETGWLAMLGLHASTPCSILKKAIETMRWLPIVPVLPALGHGGVQGRGRRPGYLGA